MEAGEQNRPNQGAVPDGGGILFAEFNTSPAAAAGELERSAERLRTSYPVAS
jgi:hypothetical protein